jgi:tetratricopeptide (TPR) repeat protein
MVLSRVGAALLACALLGPSKARAQIEAPRPVEELAPDVPGRRPVRRPPPPPQIEASTDSEGSGAAQPTPAPAPPTRRPAIRKPAESAAPAAAIPPAPAARESPPATIVVPTAGDAEILTAFRSWQEAERTHDAKGSATARARLLALREELGITNLESVSGALLRGARQRTVARDSGGAVELAQSAVALSPEVTSSHWGLFRAHLSDDPTQFARLVVDARSAVAAALRDPRWTRGILGDLGAALLVSWLATTLAVLAVLAFRSAPSLVHDVHHAFPGGVARWQTGALLALLLLLPWVFRLGVMLPALVLFGAITLYLNSTERWLCFALLAGLALLPPLAGALVEVTTFAETPAEDVLQLDRGGLEAAQAAGRVQSRLQARKATFPELFTLGRYELRRGKLVEARQHLDAALALRPSDARTFTLLGNVAFAETRWPEAISAYTRAAEADAALPDPLWNVAKVYRRHAKTLSDDAVGPELDRAQNAAAAAQRLDERLLSRTDPPDAHAPLNLLLLSPALSRSEPTVTDGAQRRTRVTAQITQWLVGDVDPTTGVLLPLGVAAAVTGLGFARGGRGVSHPCHKCGRAVCRRCDPELAENSNLCHQCVNVYARRGKVAPMARVNKEMEVRQHHAWTSRLAYGLGLLCSGAGHLFTGLTVRGALYAFLFAFAITAAVTREGLLRMPGAGAGPGVWMVLGLLLLAITWASSLRNLVAERD